MLLASTQNLSMIEFYHAPQSRSSIVAQMIEELDVGDRIRVHEVTISRPDGSGGPDPHNPNPEGKVPFLVHRGVGMTETNAILLYLTDMFPEAGMGVPPGHPMRGAYLSWLAWYGNVLEPVVHFHFMQIESPALRRTYRDLATALARIERQLDLTPWLLGDRYSAADMLISPIFHLFPALLPHEGPVLDWANECFKRPAARRQAALDQAAKPSRR
ncbi:glutathione S-transferase family protein [Pseudooceanicola sp. LIPI14-2-Ac024]|uniref:glutathione S-transferase family protein n=1 Tax=Pseudooceanicola sp. LIPI14-2-Ac024 TaxID=3344875 RepID=UPI0035D07F93